MKGFCCSILVPPKAMLHSASIVTRAAFAFTSVQAGPSPRTTIPLAPTGSVLRRICGASSSLSVQQWSPLWNQRRCRSFRFYINLDDPEDTQRHVQEELERLCEENRQETSAFLHNLLNLAMSFHQSGDYVRAREYAEYTHQRALAHNSKSSLLFLTATTCIHTARALADAYEAHLAEMDRLGETSSTLTPSPSVVFSAQRVIRKLRADAQRYEGIAERIINRPDMMYMRGQGGSGRKSGSRPDNRRAWTEEGRDVDEEYESAYGARWQSRRTRSEHASLTRHHREAAGTDWKVPR